MTLLPEFSLQLQDAARRRSRRPSLGAALPVALSVLVALGIAAVAIVALDRGRSPVHADGAASGRRELLATLGALRAPRAPGDRIPQSGPLLPGYLRLAGSPVCRGRNRALDVCAEHVQPALVRILTVPGTRYRVGLFPVSTRPSPLLPSGGIGLTVTLHGPGLYAADSGPNLTGVAALRQHGLIVAGYLDEHVNRGGNRGVIVVPDGVARVVLSSIRIRGAPSSAPRPSGIRAAVHDNLALFGLSGVTVARLHLTPAELRGDGYRSAGRSCRITFAIFSVPATATMTWLGPHGNTIRRARVALTLYAGTAHPPSIVLSRIPGCPGGPRR